MSEHTPGPWHIGKGQQAQIVYDKDGWGVANAVVFHRKHEQGSTISNARLIAAAPDLLEAAEQAIAWWNQNEFLTTGERGEYNLFDYEPEFVTSARSAIAKAKGEQS